MIKKLYPQGRKKAIELTYDDGVTQDMRFVGLLNKYGLKGTFNLNTGLMNGFTWTHECGMEIKRLSQAAARELYEGHEVASHSLTHPYLDGMSEPDIMRELGEDKKNLEALFGRNISGFALPFDVYTPTIKACAKKLGFLYSRISEVTHAYTTDEDVFELRAGIFHLEPEFKAYVDGFFETDEEMAVCRIVGHTYDLDVEDMWGDMEDIFRRVAASDDIISVTTEETVRYTLCMRKAEIGDGGIKNNGDIPLWFDIDGKTVQVAPHSEIKL